jgi:hypothetical protein
MEIEGAPDVGAGAAPSAAESTESPGLGDAPGVKPGDTGGKAKMTEESRYLMERVGEFGGLDPDLMKNSEAYRTANYGIMRALGVISIIRQHSENGAKQVDIGGNWNAFFGAAGQKPTNGAFQATIRDAVMGLDRGNASRYIQELARKVGLVVVPDRPVKDMNGLLDAIRNKTYVVVDTSSGIKKPAKAPGAGGAGEAVKEAAAEADEMGGYGHLQLEERVGVMLELAGPTSVKLTK